MIRLDADGHEISRDPEPTGEPFDPMFHARRGGIRYPGTGPVTVEGETVDSPPRYTADGKRERLTIRIPRSHGAGYAGGYWERLAEEMKRQAPNG